MLRVPLVLVGAVELAEHLLCALGGKVRQPRQVRAGVGEWRHCSADRTVQPR